MIHKTLFHIITHDLVIFCTSNPNIVDQVNQIPCWIPCSSQLLQPLRAMPRHFKWALLPTYSTSDYLELQIATHHYHKLLTFPTFSMQYIFFICCLWVDPTGYTFPQWQLSSSSACLHWRLLLPPISSAHSFEQKPSIPSFQCLTHVWEWSMSDAHCMA